MGDDWSDRWKHIRKLLERSGPFAEADFEPGPEVRLLDGCCMHIRHAGSSDGTIYRIISNIAILRSYRGTSLSR